MTETDSLTQLGARVETPASPEAAVLETVPYSRGDGPPAIVRFTCPEFTSLCPVTGQPDFAHIVIDYAPDRLLVESKSLKLFMTSFRNHGAFHEDCTVMIGRRVIAATAPLWLRIAGYWYPRGGIPIDVFWQTAGRRPRAPGSPKPASRPIAGAASACAASTASFALEAAERPVLRHRHHVEDAPPPADLLQPPLHRPAPGPPR